MKLAMALLASSPIVAGFLQIRRSTTCWRPLDPTFHDVTPLPEKNGLLWFGLLLGAALGLLGIFLAHQSG